MGGVAHQPTCVQSEFLTSKVKYCRSCESQESWLSLEHSMMKSMHYLNVDPSPHTSTSCPPDVIHVIGVPRPSLFFALRVLY